MNINFTTTTQTVTTILTTVGLKILGAIAIWIFGRWLIDFVLRLWRDALAKQKIDPTLTRYIPFRHSNAAEYCSGSSNPRIFRGGDSQLCGPAGSRRRRHRYGVVRTPSEFAGGVFLMILQPFKVGDFVMAAGVTGTVTEIDLFATTINTPDNVKTMVGNGKVFGDTIQNFSANHYRRVERPAQLTHGVDPGAAVALLKPALANLPNVLADPTPDVQILTFYRLGAVLAVRPYCDNRHYWEVYFDLNRLIRDIFTPAGFPVPEQHYALRGGEELRLAKTA